MLLFFGSFYQVVGEEDACCLLPLFRLGSSKERPCSKLRKLRKLQTCASYDWTLKLTATSFDVGKQAWSARKERA